VFGFALAGALDALLIAVLFVLVLPALLLWTRDPVFLLGYFADAFVLPVAVAWLALRRREVFEAVTNLPSHYALRVVTAVRLLEAYWTEILLRRPCSDFRKGH
jgi:hypothetical protein